MIKSPPDTNSYFGNVNPDLLTLLPITAQRVVELGCGSGALGLAFRQRQPQVCWRGIELDINAAARARQSLDAVLCSDVESITDGALKDFIGAAPDLLVFGDVLEHLRDPLTVLQRLVDHLTPSGTVVACIPNVSHWSMVDRLLRGDWTYQDQGLLDRTHLRFFSLESARRLLEKTGLRVVKMRPRSILLDNERGKLFLDQSNTLGKIFDIDPTALRERMQTLQYILVAVKPPLDNILHLHQIVMAPHFMAVRTVLPVQALNSLPLLHVISGTEMKLPQFSVDTPKILIIQRLLVMSTRAQWLETIRNMLAGGWVMVCEWDDHPDLLPKPIHNKWLVNPWLPMSTAHACQTSTPALANIYRQHNPEVEVFENALLDLPALPQKSNDRVRIIFAALNREGVNSWLAPILNVILHDYPQVDMVVVQNKTLFNMLKIELGRKSYIEALPYNDYLTLLASAHVALLPLAEIELESYKSNIKFIEAASRGAVCIASPLIYAATIQHGKTGWIAGDAGEWQKYLVRTITDAEIRLRMAQAAWQQVQEQHLLCQQIVRRGDWYRGLWQRREELTQKLRARFPELL